ncbi:MAG: membrane dipeptidase [Clostridia bacterium]|nr:membrane dipeptidase [Clostridia bacterium]
MRKLSLSDIHCDTAYEMFKGAQSFASNSLAVSANKAECFERYIQVAAIWSDKTLDNDDAYERFFRIAEYLKRDILTANDTDILREPKTTAKNNIIISVEDARILNGQLSRIDDIFRVGARIMTLLWSGETCIGGSYDTRSGLSDFGKDVVSRCAELGIIPDISHASEQSAEDVFNICASKIPVIASHSDAYSVHPHPRNLNDRQFISIKSCGGLVGINLCSEHLGISEGRRPLHTVMAHIEHYLSLGGEDTVCFGCDFDGADTPSEFQSIASLPIIAEEMARLNYKDELIDKIFFENAKSFIFKNIKL